MLFFKYVPDLREHLVNISVENNPRTGSTQKPRTERVDFLYKREEGIFDY
jgi:hypothetical protein